MEDIARGVLTGVAIGGFAAAVVEANIIAVKTLWHFNCLASETAWEMSKGVARGQLERIEIRRQERAADEGDSTVDENES